MPNYAFVDQGPYVELYDLTFDNPVQSFPKNAVQLVTVEAATFAESSIIIRWINGGKPQLLNLFMSEYWNPSSFTDVYDVKDELAAIFFLASGGGGGGASPIYMTLPIDDLTVGANKAAFHLQVPEYDLQVQEVTIMTNTGPGVGNTINFMLTEHQPDGTAVGNVFLSDATLGGTFNTTAKYDIDLDNVLPSQFNYYDIEVTGVTGTPSCTSAVFVIKLGPIA